MVAYKNLVISFEVDGQSYHFPDFHIELLPRVGERAAFDYVHGEKITFDVVEVKHHFSSIGDDILQQITIVGVAI